MLLSKYDLNFEVYIIRYSKLCYLKFHSGKLSKIDKNRDSLICVKIYFVCRIIPTDVYLGEKLTAIKMFARANVHWGKKHFLNKIDTDSFL